MSPYTPPYEFGYDFWLMPFEQRVMFCLAVLLFCGGVYVIQFGKSDWKRWKERRRINQSGKGKPGS